MSVDILYFIYWCCDKVILFLLNPPNDISSNNKHFMIRLVLRLCMVWYTLHYINTVLLQLYIVVQPIMKDGRMERKHRVKELLGV